MKLKEKLKNKHFLSLSGNVAISVFNLGAVMFLSRVLSIEAFGIWIFFQSILILLDTLRSGFLTTGFIKFYSGAEPPKAREVEGSTWYIALAITLALTMINLIAYFFLPWISNEGLRYVVLWFSFAFWIVLPFFMGSCMLQATQRFDRLLFIRVINQAGFVLGIIAFYWLSDLTISTIILCYTGSSAIGGGYCLLSGWISIGTIRQRSAAMISELFHYGKYTVGTIVSSSLFRTTDTLVMNFFLGPAALAVYTIGQRLMEVIEIPLRSFLATGMPEMAAAYNRNQPKEVLNAMMKYAGAITLAIIPATLVAVFAADIAITIIGGTKYTGTEAANVFRIFMTFALLFPIDRFFGLTLDVIHLPKINFYKVLLMLAANLIFDLVGVLIFKNVYGIAIASLIPTLIGVYVGYKALNRYYIRFRFFDVYREGYGTLIQLFKRTFAKA